MSDFNENSPFTENEKKEKVDLYKKKTFNPKIYLNTKLDSNESTREVRIRILPASPTSNKISTDIHIHSMKVPTEVAKSGFKAYTCLKDSHVTEKDDRGCPFCNMFDEYAREANDLKEKNPDAKGSPEWKSLWKQAFKFQPKIAHIVRVIDRDHEDEGVKFWRFNEWDNGKGCYDYLKEIYRQYNENAAKKNYKTENGKLPTKEELEEYMKSENGRVKEFYNVFNLEDGHDIILSLTKGENTKDRTEIKIMAELDETPLSEDETLVETWINDPKTWSDAYTVKNYDYLEVILNGGIPVFDRNLNKYVSKEEKLENDEQVEREAAEEIRNGGQTITESNENDEMELPF